jgi:hypothetical protein
MVEAVVVVVVVVVVIGIIIIIIIIIIDVNNSWKYKIQVFGIKKIHRNCRK